MNLEQTLRRASYKVWKELEPCRNKSHKIHSPREEALTSMALKAISNSNCISIEKIEMITSTFEKTRGYDFELAIGSKTNWIRFFIQAKKLYGFTTKDSYDSLEDDQIDKLISYSKSKSGLPTYAFYNHLEEKKSILQDYYNSATTFERRSLGITLTSALSIKMLKSKRFDKHHFNNGKRIKSFFTTLKSFEFLFYFYSYYKAHLSIPFHEISYLTIELAETINKLYRKRNAKGRLPLLLFFFPGLENFMDDEGDLIPILRNISSDELINDFRKRYNQNLEEISSFNPQALIIINTNE